MSNEEFRFKRFENVVYCVYKVLFSEIMSKMY